MKEGKQITINITPQSVFLFTLIPLAVYFLWIVRDILFALLIGFILMSALRPGVKALVDNKVPRSLAVVMVYLLFILFFLSLISLIVPPIVVETANLVRSLPSIIEDVNPQIYDYIGLSDLTSYIPNVTNNIFSFIALIFSNTFFIVSTLFFGLYFLLEEDLIENCTKPYLSEGKAAWATSTIKKAENRMSSWFWGELTLMTVVGLLTYIGLKIIGLKYALPLAVLAGLLEVVPNIGPVVSSIPAIIIGFSTSYFAGFAAMALYILVQQLENSVIVPMIMRRAVGINPILTLIALLIGGRIAGVLGILLAIPTFLFTETILREYLKIPKTKSSAG